MKSSGGKKENSAAPEHWDASVGSTEAIKFPPNLQHSLIYTSSVSWAPISSH